MSWLRIYEIVVPDVDLTVIVSDIYDVSSTDFVIIGCWSTLVVSGDGYQITMSNGYRITMSNGYRITMSNGYIVIIDDEIGSEIGKGNTNTWPMTEV